ncbi:MAG: DUF2946 family protein [Xanthobacteraceae bacterium]|nr:DUF2946 family protein [Xanthobacteraceae bacterium]
MQRRLGRFLPIVLLAMLVQILAPVGASWAFGTDVSDPLHLAGICSGAPDAAGDAGQADPHQTADACCTLCCVAQAATPAPDPQASFVKLQRDASAVVWRNPGPAARTWVVHAHARARAPPVVS